MAEVEGPQSALVQVDRLNLCTYHLFHAVRAELLRRLRRHAEAVAAFDLAIERCENVTERAFLRRRRDTISRFA